MPFGEAQAGRLRYSATGAAEPSGPDQVTWRVIYRVHDAGTLLSEQTMTNQWWTLDSERLERELRPHGLHLRFSGALVVIGNSPDGA